MNNKSSFLNNCYEWLFTDEEKRPIAYIIAIFIAIIISVTVTLFIVAVDRHVDGWVQYLFN
jgi:H+/Cl- antiporter ClcA